MNSYEIVIRIKNLCAHDGKSNAHFSKEATTSPLLITRNNWFPIKASHSHSRTWASSSQENGRTLGSVLV